MNPIQILVDEHVHIKKVLKAIRKHCLDVVEGKRVDPELLRDVIDFVRNYADKYHHQKEEDYLFNKIEQVENYQKNTGPIVGMLLEHDLGRSYISNLEEAIKKHETGFKDAKLDIVANAIAYVNLLTDHIHKEDNVIYQMGEKVLDKEILQSLEQTFTEIEANEENTTIRKRYIALAQDIYSRANI
ncbi:hemerythrin-like domain-containing protein [Desulfitispora alkaliphila]|uniref:hemerythrin domain-containing protein n=1 Tax=Desulfitispora alkaliphila TaxID=622674 RepID=UPI003D23E14B